MRLALILVTLVGLKDTVQCRPKGNNQVAGKIKEVMEQKNELVNQMYNAAEGKSRTEVGIEAGNDNGPKEEEATAAKSESIGGVAAKIKEVGDQMNELTKQINNPAKTKAGIATAFVSEPKEGEDKFAESFTIEGEQTGADNKYSDQKQTGAYNKYSYGEPTGAERDYSDGESIGAESEYSFGEPSKTEAGIEAGKENVPKEGDATAAENRSVGKMAFEIKEVGNQINELTRQMNNPAKRTLGTAVEIAQAPRNELKEGESKVAESFTNEGKQIGDGNELSDGEQTGAYNKYSYGEPTGAEHEYSDRESIGAEREYSDGEPSKTEVGIEAGKVGDATAAKSESIWGMAAKIKEVGDQMNKLTKQINNPAKTKIGIATALGIEPKEGEAKFAESFTVEREQTGADKKYSDRKPTGAYNKYSYGEPTGAERDYSDGETVGAESEYSYGKPSKTEAGKENGPKEGEKTAAKSEFIGGVAAKIKEVGDQMNELTKQINNPSKIISKTKVGIATSFGSEPKEGEAKVAESFTNEGKQIGDNNEYSYGEPTGAESEYSDGEPTGAESEYSDGQSTPVPNEKETTAPDKELNRKEASVSATGRNIYRDILYFGTVKKQGSEKGDLSNDKSEGKDATANNIDLNGEGDSVPESKAKKEKPIIKKPDDVEGSKLKQNEDLSRETNEPNESGLKGEEALFAERQSSKTIVPVAGRYRVKRRKDINIDQGGIESDIGKTRAVEGIPDTVTDCVLVEEGYVTAKVNEPIVVDIIVPESEIIESDEIFVGGDSSYEYYK